MLTTKCPETWMATDKNLQRFGAALVGLVLGQLAGSNSVTFAKVWWFLYDESKYTSDRVAESSLHVIYIIASMGACLGAWAVKRGWATFEQVVTSVAVAVVVAGLSIVDYSLPPVNQVDTLLPFRETTYYLGWVLGLWFVPFFLLVRRYPGDASWFHRCGGFLCVTVAVGAVGLLVGLLVETLATVLSEAATQWLGQSYIEDVQRFWVARPASINTIGGSFVVVAFASIWWRGVWPTRAGARIWTFSTVALTAAYASLYGALYCTDESSASVRCALAFGALPLVIAAGVLVSYGLARRNEEVASIGWPVSGLFWWLLPVSLAIGYSGIAILGLAPVTEYRAGSGGPAWVLVLAHAFNGACFGVALRATTYAFRLMSSR